MLRRTALLPSAIHPRRSEREQPELDGALADLVVASGLVGIEEVLLTLLLLKSLLPANRQSDVSNSTGRRKDDGTHILK